MNLNSNLKERIEQVVNVFETGSIEGEYDNISIYADGKNGTRQITFGRSQTTEQGNLKKLIELYINNFGLFSSEFLPYMADLGIMPLCDNVAFIGLLKKAAQEDAIMIETQDAFFDEYYFQPALKFAKDNGFVLPLSMLVIYDSFIHSGGVPDFLRERFYQLTPKNGGNEKAWIRAYVSVRKKWLTKKSELLAKTVYRMECFEMQFAMANWDLRRPIYSNGISIK